MGDDYLPPAWRARARRSRHLLLVIQAGAVATIAMSQWVDLAALLHRSPGLPGRYLVSVHADWVSWSAGCLSGLAALIAISSIVRMMGRFADGETFSAGVSHDLRVFAAWILAATIISVLVPLVAPAMIAAIWHVHVSVEGEIGGSDMLVLLMSGILFQVSRLLEAAHQLADDHEQFV